MRSKRSPSARRAASATASGWSAKRAAIAAGVARTWLWLPRRSGSDASSVVCSRMATKASWTSARSGAWAWTSPVATQGTPRRRGQVDQLAVQRAVVAGEGTLELDAQAVAAEGAQQPAQQAQVAHPLAGAARQADEPLGMGGDVVDRDERVAEDAAAEPVARVRVGLGQQPAEVAPPALVAHEQREVPGARGLRRGRRPRLGGCMRGGAAAAARRRRSPPPRGWPAAPAPWRPARAPWRPRASRGR